MTVASVSRTSASTSRYGLPPTLKTAQAAMQLPEVQDMLRRLSAFQRLDEIANQTASFLPVGWLWRAGAPTVAAACEMAEAEGPEDEAQQAIKHKMPEDD